MVNSRAAAQSSPTPNPPRSRPGGGAVGVFAAPGAAVVGAPVLIAGPAFCEPGAPVTTPGDAASTPPEGAPAGGPLKGRSVGYSVGWAFVSFHALIAVVRHSFANASSQPFSVSAAAATAAMAFHWKKGLLVVKIQRSSGLPEKSPFTSFSPSFGS